MMDMDVGGSSISDGEGCGEPHNSSSISTSLNTVSGSALGAGKLKRSSSAPMINQLLPHCSVSAPSTACPVRDTSMCEIGGLQPRVRRLSATFGPVSPLSPGTSRASGRMRVCQLREEEGMDIVNREAAHERNVHSTLQVSQTLSQSWEDLALTDEEPKPPAPTPPPVLPVSCPPVISQKKDYSDQLSLTISPTPTSQPPCAASPTRVGRQCFSPSLQQPIRNQSFCPSPSPTKKSYTRRSLSPIPLRPSPLGGLKRKWDIDESFVTPSKRLSVSTTQHERVSGGLLIQHQGSTLESSSTSPAGSGSIGRAGTPESVCSSGSPGPPPTSFSPATTPHLESSAHHFKPLSPYHPPAITRDSNSPHLFKPVVSPYPPSSPYGGTKSSEGSVITIGDGSESSSDAMMTDEMPSQDLKAFQAMDLTENMGQDISQGTI